MVVRKTEEIRSTEIGKKPEDGRNRGDREKTVIALLPLDERPCNRFFPSRLFEDPDTEILIPEQAGEKKKPADPSAIRAFLEEAAGKADALVLSMDMLLYGGLLPSRIHHLKKEELERRLNILREIRKEHPQLMISAFHCIMRCPDYSSGEEEPEYYEWYGKQIRDYGAALHKVRKGLPGEAEADRLKQEIPGLILQDYTNRRELNLQMNLETLRLAAEGVLDDLVIPQDDCSVYGYSAMDREEVSKEIERLGLKEQVRTYPGADEAALTLISRILCRRAAKTPACHVQYISSISKTLVPLYEGQPLAQTVQAHLESAGCRLAESLETADFVLALTGPTTDMLESEEQFTAKCADPSERDLPAMVSFMKECVRSDMPVTIGDNAYANGGDMELIRLMDREGFLASVAGYAGWNTNANTLGTAIAQGVRAVLRKRDGKPGVPDRDEKGKKFLAERYVEDAGYCAVVRKAAMDLTEEKGLSVQDISPVREEMTAYIREGLQRFLQEEMKSFSGRYELDNVSLPWDRLFEADITVSAKNGEKPEEKNPVICIDLGGTAIKYGILEQESGALTCIGERPTPVGRAAILDALCGIAKELQGEKPEAEAVCISSAGIIDSGSGIVLEANEDLMPDFTGTPIAETVSRRTGLPVHVENDVNCAALAEFHEGAAKGAESSLTLTVGTGIGGALISGGRLWKGHTFSAGEVGYIHMEGGTFEELGATSALVAAVASRTGEPADTLNGKIVFARAQQGDLVCREEIRRMCDILAKGIANLCFAFNPEVVVLGGGISAQEQVLRPLLEEGLDRYLIPAIRRETRLSFASCGNRAGMRGAWYAWKESLTAEKGKTCL